VSQKIKVGRVGTAWENRNVDIAAVDHVYHVGRVKRKLSLITEEIIKMKKQVRDPFRTTKENNHEHALHGKSDVWVVGHGTNLDDLLQDIQEKLEDDYYCRDVKVDCLNGEYVVVTHYLGKWRFE
jgi:hypothetical protein